MFNLVARTQFPEIPGAAALGLDHLGAPGRNNAEPRLFTAALADLDRDQGMDVRPIIWRDALESCELARCDLADAFARKGLIYWQGGGQWTLKGRPASLDRVCREFWPPFLAAVLADLNAKQEMPGAALSRVRGGFQGRWADAEEKREREHRAYLSRAFWPVPLAVFWICDRDYKGGLEWMADPERPDLAVYGDVRAQIDALDAQMAIDLDECAPLDQLLRAAVSIPGLLSARVPDQADYRPVDVRHIESGAFRFRGELCEGARAGDVEFVDVCVDREKLWRAFPHPAVTLMGSVRLMWERHERLAVARALIELARLVWKKGEERRAAVAIMEWVALLWSRGSQNDLAEADEATCDQADDAVFASIMRTVRAACDAVPRDQPIYIAHAIRAARAAGCKIGSKRRARVSERIRAIYGARVNERGAPKKIIIPTSN